MPNTISIRAGDTEPFEIIIGATGLDNLDELTEAVLYLRAVGEEDNHVDGAPLSVISSADRTLRFDPIGNGPAGANAFTEPGVYSGYVLATWSDDDETRHPGDDTINVVVRANYE